MAVRHGYGKIAGADALVFAYDTGDTKNSYKGEPTTNLIPNIGTSTSNWSEHGWAGDFTVSSDYSNTFELTAANGWHNATYDFGVSSGGTLTVRFEHKIKSHQTNQYNLFVLNGTNLGSYTTYIGANTQANEWQTFTGTFTANADTKLAIGIRGQDSSGLTDVIYIKNLQLELKPHATQFVNGTRSATQGLLDLTGNRSIDLSNLNGYDSNAQLVHDGTDDYIHINPFTPDVSNGLSYEVVYSAESTYSTWGTYHYLLRFVGTTHYGLLHEGDSRGWRFDVPSTAGSRLGATTSNPNATAGAGYYHVAVSFDPVTGGKGYLNGEQIGSWSGGYTPFTPSSLIIGAESTTTRFWDGEIPVVKVYNRALTAAEVKNNFNNYKGRFNL